MYMLKSSAMRCAHRASPVELQKHGTQIAHCVVMPVPMANTLPGGPGGLSSLLLLLLLLMVSQHT
jgi:hypothetical protein